jgi:hypothetical protein
MFLTQTDVVGKTVKNSRYLDFKTDAKEMKDIFSAKLVEECGGELKEADFIKINPSLIVREELSQHNTLVIKLEMEDGEMAYILSSSIDGYPNALIVTPISVE